MIRSIRVAHGERHKMKSKRSSTDEIEDHSETQGDRYRAPALEKGLDILELLSNERSPMTLTTICARLQRSQGELFRMVQVLHTRGYIDQEAKGDGYFLTDMMFSMAMQQPVTQGLVEVAIPIMRSLATEVGQSCHLALYTRGDIVVVARMESSEQLGFTVRVGYRRPINRANSGIVLFAFQPDDVRTRWLDEIDPAPSIEEREEFISFSDAAKTGGYAKAHSSYVSGVTDLSVPILRGDRAAAALTIPFLKTFQTRKSMVDVIEALKGAARDIADQLTQADARA